MVAVPAKRVFLEGDRLIARAGWVSGCSGASSNGQEVASQQLAESNPTLNAFLASVLGSVVQKSNVTFSLMTDSSVSKSFHLVLPHSGSLGTWFTGTWSRVL